MDKQEDGRLSERKTDKEKTDKHANALKNIQKMYKFINRHTYK
jgi:hypothetical protein